MKPELIIFDFDGVLIDSEIIGHTINATEMTRLGFPITVEKSIELLTGITKDGFDKVMLEHYGKTLSDTEVMEIVSKIEGTFPSDLKSIVDIAEVLDYLEFKKIKKCIASNGGHEYVLSNLEITNLTSYFKPNQIVSAPKGKGKPEPDVFLLAAQVFKVHPHECLVIEDSALGIQAAKAANMPVIGFLGASHAQNQLYRDYLLKSGPTQMVHCAIELLDELKNIYE